MSLGVGYHTLNVIIYIKKIASPNGLMIVLGYTITNRLGPSDMYLKKWMITYPLRGRNNYEYHNKYIGCPRQYISYQER